MKTILFRAIIIALFAGTAASCSDEDENRLRSGSTYEKPNPTEPEGGLDYSKLIADNHPRLLVNAEAFTALKAKVDTNSSANLALLHNTIMGVRSSKGMNATALIYKLDASNKRILDVSRDALLRTFICAYIYRTTGDIKYPTKVETDINAAHNLPDWNSKRHFLDVGEMIMTAAFSYDWPYNELSVATRTKAANALLKFAFQQAQDRNWNLSFYEATNNWNQVYNGGLVCAVSASYENNPSEAKGMIEKASELNKPALEATYSPDGNYLGGNGYWCYGTFYQVLTLAALNSTSDMDNGLSDIPGFSRTAEYMLYMTGLNSKSFNYSDCAPSSTVTLVLWWFADKYSNLSLLYNELKILKNGEYASCAGNHLLPMVVTFVNNPNLDTISVPSNKLRGGKGETPVVMIHTDWTYTDTDKYLGIKGGRAGSNHEHMDTGSFVYDAYGVCWSMDFGLQSYTTLELVLVGLSGNLWDMGQSPMRWDVPRSNNLNHSTTSINDARHRVDGMATPTTTINTATELGATFDLTEVVSDQAAFTTRTAKIVNDRDLVIMDGIKARTDKSARVCWCMVTPVVPTVESNRIVLANGSKVICLTASGSVKPTYRQWSTTSENFHDQTNPGTYMVGFEATVTANQIATFTTILSPK